MTGAANPLPYIGKGKNLGKPIIGCHPLAGRFIGGKSVGKLRREGLDMVAKYRFPERCKPKIRKL